MFPFTTKPNGLEFLTRLGNPGRGAGVKSGKLAISLSRPRGRPGKPIRTVSPLAKRMWSSGSKTLYSVRPNRRPKGANVYSRTELKIGELGFGFGISLPGTGPARVAEPQPLSRFSSNAPDELQTIVSKMLRKNRDERYQTMKDVLTNLKSLRETLAYDERSERSYAPGDKNATAILQPTGAANNRADETNDYSTIQIKRQKSLAALLFAALFIGAIGFGYYFWPAGKSLTSVDGKKSLAVLPFVNISQDPNAEYLSEGITESVINNLSQLAGLKVMSRNSAFRFKNNQSDSRNIASQLGVENLVTGDIRQIGDKLVINVRLIDASDDSQIWGNQYVKTSADIIAAQNEIAQAVAQNLRLKLTNSEKQRLGKNYTDNAEAYQLYLRGRFHVFKLTPPEVQKGIQYLHQAIEIDPSYAAAYVGLSEAYRTLALAGELNPNEYFPKAKAASNKAIEIDDALAEAHGSLAVSMFWYDWNWAAAEEQNKRALELNPNSSITLVCYAHLLSNIGRHAEALSVIKRATEIDPLNPFANSLEGQFLLHAGRTDEALAKLQKTFELDPNFFFPHMFAVSVYYEKGMYAEALVEGRLAKELSPNQTTSDAYSSYALVKSGKREEARAVLDGLLKKSTERFVPPSHIALIYNGLGETDKTYEWLERAFEQRDPKMAFLKVEPKWNNLRNEPRFIDLVSRMNFPE